MNQDLKTLYRITKDLKVGFTNRDMPVKENDGNILASEAEKLYMYKWIEPFQTILNRSNADIILVQAGQESKNMN